MQKLIMLGVSFLAGLFLLTGVYVTSKAQDVETRANVVLSRIPAPPAYVQPGEAMLFSWTIEFSTTPFSYTLSVFDRSIAEGGGNRLFYQVFNAAGAASPITGTLNWTVPATVTLDSNPDPYRVELDFYSDFPTGLEDQARQVFLVGIPTPTPTLTPTPRPPEPTPVPTDEPPQAQPTNTPLPPTPTFTPVASPTPLAQATPTSNFPTTLPETGAPGSGAVLFYITLILTGIIALGVGRQAFKK